MKYFQSALFIILFFVFYSCQPGNNSNTESTDIANPEVDEVIAPDTIPYSKLSFIDSISTNPENEKAPVAYYSETWIIPESKDTALNKFITSSIINELVFEAGATHIETPKEAFDESKGWFFNDFTDLASDFETAGGFTSETESYVEFNSKKLLTLSFFTFSYTGGAHGNYGATYITLDLENHRKLQLEDIFKPGYEEILTPLIEKGIREHFELEESTPLEQVLFEPTVPITDNFGLLEDEILFDYPPYMIAPYAAGEIEARIKYEEIKDYLKEGIRF